MIVIYSLYSFLSLTFILVSLFYILIYLYFIHLLILFAYLFVCFYFHGWCDILRAAPRKYQLDEEIVKK